MDRDKVIKGIECCIDYAQRVKDLINDVPCEGCPYVALKSIAVGQGDCIDSLFKDAIALLKAQEPMVMTLEEYEAWTNLPFTERDPVFHEERTERGIVTCWVNTTVCSLCEYGKNDRCWTSRPTEEQREATLWN